MKYYPVFLNIADKRCTVVGGGEVAARKVSRLLDCGAQVVVISPKLIPELIILKAESSIEHIEADYNVQYIQGSTLIVGATDDEKTNALISSDARSLGIPVNIVDDPEKCDFILPSVVERGDLTIAVSTAGNSPALSRYLREELEVKYGREYEVMVRILGSLRTQIKASGKGKDWLNSFIERGILNMIKAEDWENVRRTVKEITGEEVIIR